jgi:uncharacterized protein YdiU (UPF0061 family)
VSIVGETIDYGPCAFMDRYNLDTVFSSIDHQGRYAFGNQPVIMQWNLARLAETLLPLIDTNEEKAIESATEVLHRFETRYQEAWLSGMRGKLGLGDAQANDLKLVESLLNGMATQSMDFTNTFYSLTRGDFLQTHNDDEILASWYAQWRARRESDSWSDERAGEEMRNHNPAMIPRNHIVESVLESAVEGNWQPWDEFLAKLRQPYSHAEIDSAYQEPAPADAPAYRTFCGT